MRFRDLAWGALVYHNANKRSQGEMKYDGLAGDQGFLGRLQQDPSSKDFERIRDFLVHFGVRFAPKSLHEELGSAWPYIKPHIGRLGNETLVDCDFSNDEVKNALRQAYSYLLTSTWGAATATAKMIHFFNVHLFVMWDDDIHSAYAKQFLEPGSYLEFLQEMQKQGKLRRIFGVFRYLALPKTGFRNNWVIQ